ncbi:MAG: NTP transferase domain-containing protein [Chloroflexota bacterium]|nr:NTP transferase domain-containing protein [Dehalococcoidia bacterium]MDW8252590.1 NTP transferase domain-containing protein [Chloroflexota bacterium]
MSEEPPSPFAAVVLAAGRGTRFGSPLPKVLQPLAGRPLLGHVLAALDAAGASRTVLVLGYGADHVRAVFPEREFVLQADQLGTGHALLQARSAFTGTEDLVIIYGDVPLVPPDMIATLHRARREAGAAMALLTCDHGDPTGLGRVVRRGGRPVAVVEERVASEEERAIREWNTGLYAFAGEWLWPRLESLRPSATGELFLTDLVALAAAEETLTTVTTHDALAVAGINDRTELARSEAVLRERIRRRLLERGVLLISPETTVIDIDVEVGFDTVILPGSLLLGRTRVGRGCRIGPHAILEDAVIGDGATVRAADIRRAVLPPGSVVESFQRIAGDAAP